MSVLKPASDVVPKRSSTYAGAIGLLLLLLIVGGGFAAWRYSGVGVSDIDPKELADVDAIGPRVGWRNRPPNLQQFAARIAAGVPDGVSRNGVMFIAKAGNASAVLEHLGANWRLRLNYPPRDLLSQDQMQTLLLINRVSRDQAKARTDGIKPDQLEKLRALQPPFIGLSVEPADREAIRALFLNWLQAAGGSSTASTQPAVLPASTSPAARDAEQKLIAALSDLAKRQADPTRQQYQKRIDQVQAILGPDLIAKLKSGG